MHTRFTVGDKTYEIHYRGYPSEDDFFEKLFTSYDEMQQFLDESCRSDPMLESKLVTLAGESGTGDVKERIVRKIQDGVLQISIRGVPTRIPFNVKPRKPKEPEYVPEPVRLDREEELDLDYKIVVEVAGICQDMNQVVVYGNRQAGLIELNEGATPYKKDGTLHRSLVTISNIPNQPRNLGLRISMHKSNASATEPPLNLPFVENVLPVHKDTEMEEWDNVIIPVKPLGYITENKLRPESNILPHGGWVYVFKEGKVWRELLVNNHQTYRDTRLHYYRSMRTNQFAMDDSEKRKALGAVFHTIWIPFKANGSIITGYRMMYSRKQLTWEQIDQLENSPVALEKRTTPIDAIDVYESGKHFDLNSGPVGPIAPALLDQNPEVVPPPENPRKKHSNYLDEHRGDKFAVVYLDAVPKVLQLYIQQDIKLINEQKDDIFYLGTTDESWYEQITLKEAEPVNDSWIKIAFEDPPEGGEYDLIRVPVNELNSPEFILKGQPYSKLQELTIAGSKALQSDKAKTG
ncbi:hypothetical protein H0A36_11630 [Endozoicomonas sp. SM1973]|uniref:Uncharacterized protein n=1 Tax=Spartinivicinus marinus TaxID=2994442 RepID=A0A853HY31_9GAMM|nr:hypothetical protein [Spartinivicinus marinus]MCX4027642.1 hypothetical protein [Spartinivicinus marinus]NYZ66660.1 hypothetical protein [Spartinivicinus marinus]